MAKKGLDTSFVHYGIRRDDMSMIEAICTEHGLDFEWMKEEILKEFHERRIRNQELDDKSLEKLLEKALLKIK